MVRRGRNPWWECRLGPRTAEQYFRPDLAQVFLLESSIFCHRLSVVMSIRIPGSMRAWHTKAQPIKLRLGLDTCRRERSVE